MNDTENLFEQEAPAKVDSTLPKTDDAAENFEAILEAVLFAAGHPVSYMQLSSLFGMAPAYISERVHRYAEEYNNALTNRGILMLAFDDTCQLCTKEQYLPYIREALGIRRSGTLSNSSIEVLAVVAYNQPVTRAYIDAVRGVDSAYAVSSLLERGLIHAIGRLDAPGRPMLYGTTDDFLRCFGLTSLTELPGVSTAEADELFERLKKKVNAFDVVSENQISMLDMIPEEKPEAPQE
ncbi:MAG: SMC-Scp complex subunit ScpB [Clostridia bacterium]|nr:SMC-Scp complex subunit ScpB [Clostridia bacterium]